MHAHMSAMGRWASGERTDNPVLGKTTVQFMNSPYSEVSLAVGKKRASYLRNE